MQCQSCQDNEATIHLTEITDGVRSEMHLCEQCAVAEGIHAKSPIPLNELLSSLLAAQPDDSELFGSADPKQPCPYCGFTLDNLRKESVLGCPRDYDLFEESLGPLIAKAHDGRTQHCGKVPAGVPGDARVQTELISLRSRLDKAVKDEDYEQAAELRDQINKLETSGSDDEAD